MPKLAQLGKYLVAGVSVFCVSWLACVGEWRGRGRWTGGGRAPAVRTIVAYSAGKLAELDRATPVTCDRLPAFPDVPNINRTWLKGVPGSGKESWQKVSGASVTLYQAYYDERLPQRYVRILASFPGHFYPIEEQLYCQTRPKYRESSDDPSVEVVAAKPQEIWYEQWNLDSDNVDTPLLLSCPLTEPLYGPSIVSIVTETCEDPNNAFLIEPSKSDSFKRLFTVCVKDLTYDKDITTDLVEWIETNKILGVEAIDVYVDTVHKRMEEALEYYRSTGYVRLFSVPVNHSPQSNLWQRRRDHVITYNDCLYRNIGDSKFIIPLDVDEIVLPKIANNLSQLTERLFQHGWNTAKSSAAVVQNVFFFDFMQKRSEEYKNFSGNSDVYEKRDDVRISDGRFELDKTVANNAVIGVKDISEKFKYKCNKYYVPRLARHSRRSALVSPEGAFSKSLMATRHVLMAFNHYPLASVGSIESSPSDYWFAPFREVQLNHYKEECNRTLVHECALYEQKAVEDTTALRLRTRLVAAMARLPCFGPN